MSRKISPEDVRKIARLSRLELTDEEAATYTRQIGNILDYMDELGGIDTSNIPAKVHAIDISNVFREDTVTPGLDHEAALRESPEHDDNFFIVPKVFDN